jgi:hypothetical protein
MLNFTYEDDIEVKNKNVAGISLAFYLPIETIRRPPQSRETIPLKEGAHDVKWDQLICQNPQLNASKILTRVADVLRIRRLVCHANVRVSAKLTRGVHVLQRHAKP